MNRLIITGNLTRNPESRVVGDGKTVCSFTVAVNKRGKRGEQDGAEFFRVSTWDKLAENCQKFLEKGKKVAVVGSVSASVYAPEGKEPRATLEVRADDVEFLSSKSDSEPVNHAPEPKETEGYIDVTDDMDSDLPF